MTTIINAVTSTGLTQTADGSGIIKVQSNGVTTNALAWCNFDGTAASPITPKSNYNIGSVTKTSTGYYTLNFTSALSDANYSVCASTKQVDSSAFSGNGSFVMPYSFSTTSVKITTGNASGVLTDMAIVCVAIFGN